MRGVSLADILITLILSGYYDPELRSAIDHASQTKKAATRWSSGRTTFPDSLYDLTAQG